MKQVLLNADFKALLDEVTECLPFDQSIQALWPRLVEVIRGHVAINAAAVIRRDASGRLGEAVWWSDEAQLPAERLVSCFDADSRADLLRFFAGPEVEGGVAIAERAAPGVGSDMAGDQTGEILADRMAAFLPEEAAGLMEAWSLPLRHHGVLLGVVIFCRRPDSPWTEAERLPLRGVTQALSVFLAGRDHCREQEFHNQVLNAALDQARVSLYVTHPVTDRILYMNKSMKDLFGLKDPEGKVCWQVLQRNKKRRCEFCPVPHLQEHPEDRSVYRWVEHNNLSGRVFENHDSLMTWSDGALVHLQQSIDITDSRRLFEDSELDELTGLPGHRAGISFLERELVALRESEATMVVGFFDVNHLKKINDTYGHAEGDRVLRLVAQTVRAAMNPPDFCFRMSGDEFVVVLHESSRHMADVFMERISRALEEQQRDMGVPYRLDFCFGGYEVRPGHDMTATEILTKADECMYERKKMFHIQEGQRRLTEDDPTPFSSAANRPDFGPDALLLYDALAKSTDSYVYVSDGKSGTFRYASAMVEEFGLPGETVENAAAVWGAHVHPDDKRAFLEANQSIADGRSDSHCVEYRARNRKGEWVWVRCRGQLERDAQGEPCLFAGFITNLGHKNKIDHVTGLFNTSKFGEDVAVMLRHRPDYPLSLLVLGADGFKRINDLYNRAFGDEVLRVTAQKIKEMLPSFASVYRLDSDVFGIIVEGDRDTACALFRSIRESFRFQQEYDGRKYFFTMSAGCVGYPQDAASDMELVQCAMYALDDAKSRGGNRLALFSNEHVARQRRALELLELLRESIDHDFEGFSLVFQPQVTVADGRVTGAEALARWSCAKYGSISPIEFVPLLEKSGLIVPFGKWVFREAAVQCKQWIDIQPDFVVSVNLSYLQVTADNMLPFINNMLKKMDLSPDHLVVEFTESLMIRENEQVSEIFSDLRGMGIRIAMDDFGTGYSSLGMLKKSPADVVKIDRTFVRDILVSSFDATFIRFVVALCHDVGIKVCLEGVEQEEELDLLRPMGLDYIQGYFFGKPVPPVEFEARFLGRLLAPGAAKSLN